MTIDDFRLIIGQDIVSAGFHLRQRYDGQVGGQGRTQVCCTDFDVKDFQRHEGHQ